MRKIITTSIFTLALSATIAFADEVKITPAAPSVTIQTILKDRLKSMAHEHEKMLNANAVELEATKYASEKSSKCLEALADKMFELERSALISEKKKCRAIYEIGFDVIMDHSRGEIEDAEIIPYYLELIGAIDIATE